MRARAVGLPHRVEADDVGQGLEASPLFGADFLPAFVAGVHVVPVQRVLHRHFVQRFVQILHVRHLTTNRVELLHLCAGKTGWVEGGGGLTRVKKTQNRLSHHF